MRRDDDQRFTCACGEWRYVPTLATECTTRCRLAAALTTPQTKGTVDHVLDSGDSLISRG